MAASKGYTYKLAVPIGLDTPVSNFVENRGIPSNMIIRGCSARHTSKVQQAVHHITKHAGLSPKGMRGNDLLPTRASRLADLPSKVDHFGRPAH